MFLAVSPLSPVSIQTLILASLKSLMHLGCVKVRKIFEDTGETFEAGMEAFKQHGYEKQWTERDGVQTFLNEKYWNYENENQMKMF